ncbi:DUF2914 domain-containing protein [Pseudoalteromonas sp. OOF1S-7]|uniref:DUF2914 domain-containing protein n=1 Tax=Pseudoalteromonas sp. OOF1S-7 TaxID=2917757 RepID=UPI001EF410F9|nr:DUF2914 domain-containing protein [Pseudoalteromonas sp. OOF1S-7]MCG7537489.1 DUF2914 domain-containing protein [Pseudoalteromonas sp. OOF1S-7]
MTQRIVIKTAVTKANEGPARPVTYQYHWRRIGVVGSVAACGLAALFYGIVNSVSADEQPVSALSDYQVAVQPDPQPGDETSGPENDPVPVSVGASAASEFASEPLIEVPPTQAAVTAAVEPIITRVDPALDDEQSSGDVEPQIADIMTDEEASDEPTKRFADDAQVASVAMAAQVDTNHVSRAVLTSEVVNREPVDVLKDSVEQSAFADKLYFFTEVRGLQGQTIRHLWFHQDQLMAEIDLAISAYRHRTYSSKNIMPSQSGQWRIEVITADDQLLAQKTFRIIATAQ